MELTMRLLNFPQYQCPECLNPMMYEFKKDTKTVKIRHQTENECGEVCVKTDRYTECAYTQFLVEV